MVTSLQEELIRFQEVEPYEWQVSTELQMGISTSVGCSWKKNHCTFLIVLNVHSGPVAGSLEQPGLDSGSLAIHYYDVRFKNILTRPHSICFL